VIAEAGVYVFEREGRALRSMMLPLLVLLTAVTAAWFGRGTLLRAAAELWIISDDVVPADAVVVFGRGVRTRPLAAREYFGKGLVNKILLANSDRDFFPTARTLDPQSRVGKDGD
jgi:hypothetical protein